MPVVIATFKMSPCRGCRVRQSDSREVGLGRRIRRFLPISPCQNVTRIDGQKAVFRLCGTSLQSQIQSACRPLETDIATRRWQRRSAEVSGRPGIDLVGNSGCLWPPERNAALCLNPMPTSARQCRQAVGWVLKEGSDYGDVYAVRGS